MIDWSSRLLQSRNNERLNDTDNVPSGPKLINTIVLKVVVVRSNQTRVEYNNQVTCLFDQRGLDDPSLYYHLDPFNLNPYDDLLRHLISCPRVRQPRVAEYCTNPRERHGGEKLRQNKGSSFSVTVISRATLR